MDNNEILSLIRTALNEVAPNRTADFEKVAFDDKISDLGLDSIATMEMVGFIEEKIDATFPDEELAQVAAISDLAGLVRGSVPA
jgi:acyl carrier protein